MRYSERDWWQMVWFALLLVIADFVGEHFGLTQRTGDKLEISILIFGLIVAGYWKLRRYVRFWIVLVGGVLLHFAIFWRLVDLLFAGEKISLFSKFLIGIAEGTALIYVIIYLGDWIRQRPKGSPKHTPRFE